MGVVWAWPRISVWPVVVITLLCVVMEKCLRADARSTADWVWGKTQRNRTFLRKWRVSKGLNGNRGGGRGVFVCRHGNGRVVWLGDGDEPAIRDV